MDLALIFCREDTQPPRVGVAPGGRHLEAGGQLGAAGVRHHQGHFAGALRAGVVREIFAVQQHSAPLGGQLRCQRLEQGGFSRAVGADKSEDGPLPDAESDVLHQGRFAVADGKVLGAAVEFRIAHFRPSCV